ncbi:MAG TPA: SPOR domain-containing protein [Thiobacillus sp.]|nr:SPOR domain-containing protein [Thiobacillus sp.]
MAKPASRKSGRSGGSSIFTGVLIGLIVGAVLAVGVALWVTGNNPFKFVAPESAPAKPAPAMPATPETAPSFDFYKVLPGDASTGSLPPAADSAAASPLYYLQAGAFQNPADADNLKAQLALLGIETAIQTSDLGDKGVFHRVRVGPFRAMDEVNRTRSLLTQNNIPATLVKEVPTPQETP